MKNIKELQEGGTAGVVRLEVDVASLQVEGGVHGLNSCVSTYAFGVAST